MGTNEVRTVIRVWSVRTKVTALCLATLLGFGVVGIGIVSAVRKAQAASSVAALVPGGGGVEYLLFPEVGLTYLGTALLYLVWLERPREGGVKR